MKIKNRWIQLRSEKGQGLVEYLILVALVAVAAIAVVSVVGSNVREQYARVSKSLSNKRDNTNLTDVEERHTKARGMDDFNEAVR